MYSLLSNWTQSLQTSSWNAITTQLERVGGSLESSLAGLSEVVYQKDVLKEIDHLTEALKENELFELLFPENSVKEVPETPNTPTTSLDHPSISIISLPDELILHVLSQTDIFSMTYRVPLVCQRWVRLANDPFLWRNLYFRDVSQWECFQWSHVPRHVPRSSFMQILHTTNHFYGRVFGAESGNLLPEQEKPKKPSLSWKQKYLIQHDLNSDEYRRHVQLRTCPVSNHRINLNPKGALTFSPVFSPTYKVLIMGEGLKTSARQLVYDMMWGERTPFRMTKLHPGNEGIGSGVGFEVNGVDFNLTAIYNHKKALSRAHDREKWVDLFRESHALLFVMDLTGYSRKIHQELEMLLDPQMGFHHNLPLLILACKNSKNDDGVLPEEDTDGGDSSSEAPVSPKGVAEIAERLRLEEMTRPWCVRSVEVKTLDGIYQGLDWLIPVM